MIDGWQADVAIYRLAGVVGVDPNAFTLREVWRMYAGKMQAIRQQCVWQSVAKNGLEKLDIQAFVRCGYVGGVQPKKLTMSNSLRRSVEEEIDRTNRKRKEVPLG